MAKIFQTLARKVRGGSTGNASNLVPVGMGRALANRFRLRAAELALGRAVTVESIDYRTPVVMGRAITPSVAGDLVDPHGLGRALANQIAPAPVPVSQGRQVTRLFLANTAGLVPLGTATNPVNDNNDWANPGNFDGAVSGVTAAEASMTGGKGLVGLTAKGGGLRGPFEDPVAGKDQQTITSVTLRVYLRQTGTALGNGTLAWRLIGPLARALGAETGNVNQEYTYDLTADVGGDWDNLRGLAIEVEGSSALLGRSVFARYAVIDVVSELEITP